MMNFAAHLAVGNSHRAVQHYAVPGLREVNFVFKMMDFVFKMMDFFI